MPFSRANLFRFRKRQFALYCIVDDKTYLIDVNPCNLYCYTPAARMPLVEQELCKCLLSGAPEFLSEF